MQIFDHYVLIGRWPEKLAYRLVMLPEYVQSSTYLNSNKYLFSVTYLISIWISERVMFYNMFYRQTGINFWWVIFVAHAICSWG
jgi:hypothetical protein